MEREVEEGDVLIRPYRYILAALLPAVAFAALTLFPSFGVTAVSSRSPVLSGIHAWTNEIYTRVAIYTGEEVEWHANTASAVPAQNLPPRIFVDIRGAEIDGDILHKPVGINNGLLQRVRAGRNNKDTIRVVIDLERDSTFRVFALPDPYRIIIDVDGEGEIPLPRENTAATQNPPAVSVDAPREPAILAEPPSPAPPVSRRVRVMLDPGHGGKDPGAVGPTGLKEKDVVLAIGRMVRERMARHNDFEVRMTRDSDVFIPLEERTAIANRSRADIFVSLHINASPSRAVKGVSTYVFSRGAGNQEDLELAARENGVPVARLQGVKFIVDDMFTGARKNESLRLAKTVNDAIHRTASSGRGSVANLGLKQAPFFVLVGARMPSILVESHFISNAQEEALLRDEKHLGKIADGIVEAICYYGRKGVFPGQEL
ncbi:MAG: N-acetylmuramoyl-L-alanine amidase [Syntrophorhabdaceae bacterium]|nr:N-acetylmuramoyl-L-alanine amidase [Syntrophorhabdaceae bacterium]